MRDSDVASSGLPKRTSVTVVMVVALRLADPTGLIVAVLLSVFSWHDVRAQTDGDSFFESRVRPILVEHCVSCHGQQKQNGGLRLDTAQGILQGGDSGPAIVAGVPGDSLMIQAVVRSAELAMPPEKPLSQQQIADLKKWVSAGAPWPASAQPLAVPDSTASRHWAFQPVRSVRLPDISKPDHTQNPIDAFVAAKLVEAGLASAPEADRRTLIRRLAYSLTGLPPSFEEVRTFVNNSDANAYEQLVEHYLASPQYGEHWARHWLDVARYADTKGYVYAREERFWVHAWRYRDWVVDALNEDMPYDRFLLLQLAADQVPDARPQDAAAMGFLTIGRRFLGVNRDIIDDRIDVVTRGTMALTVSCARCHDHKYDPIPTADYYSLYGVFNSCQEQFVRIDSHDYGDEYEQELTKRWTALQQKLTASRAESAARVRSRIREYLEAQTELEKYPASGFDQVFQTSDLLPAFVRRWETYLHEAGRRGDPVFVPWHRFADLKPEQFPSKAMDVCQALQTLPPAEVNSTVASAFAAPPSSFSDVIDRYAELFRSVDHKWQQLIRTEHAAGRSMPEGLPDAADEQLRQVLYGPGAPCEVPDAPIVHTERYLDTGTRTVLWKLQGEVDRWLIQKEQTPAYALTLIDRPYPTEPRVFRRGNPVNKGANVPRRFLAVLSDPEQKPFTEGSGRLELAQKITAASNPLTARVIVNRVWAQHFGQGLVSTLSDFGLRSEAPSHPELLDWLTTQFVNEGWSLRSLHRKIVTSAAFRQSSRGPNDRDVLLSVMNTDPDNRLLWRMSPRRLTFEQFRDSMLAATGELDMTTGGKPSDLFRNPDNTRRTLYGLVDRQFLPAVLRVFDFANPDLHVAERAETTVPQQALFFINHPFVLQRARTLSAVCSEDAAPVDVISQMFQRVLQRNPTATELKEAMALVTQRWSESKTSRITAADWSYGYGAYEETADGAAAARVKDFRVLPHFTGESWQGGPQWPDPALGWVQLSAGGGHPGNTRDMAAIRRWTAPRDMTIRIQSQLVHEPAAGDGVRAFIVSSNSGQLAQAKVHQSSAKLNVDGMRVAKGETIDLVVDIDKVLNSDQYLWTAVISDASPQPSSDLPVVWDSMADFTANSVERLDGFEQLAQILFCSNEFLFAD